MYNLSMSPYYQPEEGEESPFICSAPRENGMLRCRSVPPSAEGGADCSLAAPPQAGGGGADGCVNWNRYYNVCQAGELNPHKGAVNFDNIGYAWIAIFQVRGKDFAVQVREGGTRLRTSSQVKTHLPAVRMADSSFPLSASPRLLTCNREALRDPPLPLGGFGFGATWRSQSESYLQSSTNSPNTEDAHTQTHTDILIPGRCVCVLGADSALDLPTV